MKKTFGSIRKSLLLAYLILGLAVFGIVASNGIAHEAVQNTSDLEVIDPPNGLKPSGVQMDQTVSAIPTPTPCPVEVRYSTSYNQFILAGDTVTIIANTDHRIMATAGTPIDETLLGFLQIFSPVTTPVGEYSTTFLETISFGNDVSATFLRTFHYSVKASTRSYSIDGAATQTVDLGVRGRLDITPNARVTSSCSNSPFTICTTPVRTEDATFLLHDIPDGTGCTVPSLTPTPTPGPFPTPYPEFDLSISQSGSPNPVGVNQPLTYALTVTFSPTGPNTGAGPQVRFNFPSGVPIAYDSASGTRGFIATPDATGVTFAGGGLGDGSRTAVLSVIVIPQSTGTLTSAGTNVVVDPNNLVSETSETNNTAQTIVTTVVAAPATYEGDINRTSVGTVGFGDGDVNVGDQIQYQRFLAGLDCPAFSPDEQRRLDSGPRSTLGDGFFGSSDGTAIDAYSRHDASTDFNPNTAGWQPTPAGGPAAITNLGCSPANAPEVPPSADLSKGVVPGRPLLRIASDSDRNSSKIAVDIEMDAQGNEAGTQYTLRFDPSVLSVSDVSGINANPDINLSSDSPLGTTLNVNAERTSNGMIGIIENFNGASDSIKAIPQGPRRIARVTFHVRSGASSGESAVTFDDSVVKGTTADTDGLLLETTFDQNGKIAIMAAPGASISGRITAPEGRGVRNAAVTIVDRTGFARTVTTSSFGYYLFDGLMPGGGYTIALSSRAYRFESRTIALADGLTEVDFSGLE